MEWRRIVLSAEQRLEGAGQDLKIDFEIAFIAAGVPEAAALFVQAGNQGEQYYFSPEATRIYAGQLDSARAVPCRAPLPEHVSLAVGHGQAAGLLAEQVSGA